MRRALLVFGATGALLALTGGIAYAAFIVCDGGACVGTDRSDEMIGSSVRDRIFARGGYDQVDAHEGRDYVKAGAQGDEIRADTGDDEVIGLAGDDFILGGAGDDELRGGRSSRSGGETLSDDSRGGDTDRVFGGTGYEHVDVRDGDGRDSADCGAGNEFVVADPGDTLTNCPTASR